MIKSLQARRVSSLVLASNTSDGVSAASTVGKRERTADDDTVMEEAQAREAKRAKTEDV